MPFSDKHVKPPSSTRSATQTNGGLREGNVLAHTSILARSSLIWIFIKFTITRLVRSREGSQDHCKDLLQRKTFVSSVKRCLHSHIFSGGNFVVSFFFFVLVLFFFNGSRQLSIWVD